MAYSLLWASLPLFFLNQQLYVGLIHFLPWWHYKALTQGLPFLNVIAQKDQKLKRPSFRRHLKYLFKFHGIRVFQWAALVTYIHCSWRGYKMPVSVTGPTAKLGSPVANSKAGDYSQFSPKPPRPPYQLAPIPTRPNQLAPLISPTRPTSTTNSPHVVCQLAQFYDQLAPIFTNSSHFAYQLAPLLLPIRPTFLPTPPTSRTK